jgi:glycosyltransferase involved in cell wall biosynthesis
VFDFLLKPAGFWFPPEIDSSTGKILLRAFAMLAASVESLQLVSYRIAIVLPTFNGEKFLAEQLESLLNQSYKNLIIVIRDDGSTDNTMGIIRQYQNQFPEQIHVVDSQDKNLGACGSFAFLMQYVLDHKQALELDGAYMMFCDQDDIWNKDKVSRQASIMLEEESDKPQMPILIHSDLTVVSQTNELIAESFVEYQGLNAAKRKPEQIALSNTVTGCTAMINEPLIRRALSIPQGAIMHDWWLALVAATFGMIHYIDEPLVRYRQHGRNTVGATQYAPSKSISTKTVKEILTRKPYPHFIEVADQAEVFIQRFSRELSFPLRFRLSLVKWLKIQSIFVQRILFRLLRI